MSESPADASTSESRTSFVAAVAAEIEAAERAAERPGWSPWAFAAAIAGTTWSLISELESGHFQSQQSWLLAAYLVMLGESVRRAWRAWGSQATEESLPPTYQRAYALRRSQPSMLFTILVWSGIAVLHVSAARIVPLGAWWTATAALVVLTICMALVVVVLLSDIPVPVGAARSSKNNRRLGRASLVLSMLLVALLYCAATFDRAEALASAKSVLLVAALVWLVEGFLRQPENVPLIDDLEELRRDVVLEGSDPHMAMRKLRILVRGSRIEDVVQPHVLGCLREIDTAIREVEAAIQDLRHLVMMLEQGSGELAEQEIGFVRMTHASHDRHVEDANAARGRARAEYERLQKTLTKVRLSDGEAQLINRVGMYVFERDSQIDRLEVVRTELGVAARAALDARLPPE